MKQFTSFKGTDLNHPFVPKSPSETICYVMNFHKSETEAVLCTEGDGKGLNPVKIYYNGEFNQAVSSVDDAIRVISSEHGEPQEKISLLSSTKESSKILARKVFVSTVTDHMNRMSTLSDKELRERLSKVEDAPASVNNTAEYEAINILLRIPRP